MSDAVTVEYGDGVIEITINRPEARNALNGAVRTGITEALAELDGRDELAIDILTGGGGRHVQRGHGLQGVPGGQDARGAGPRDGGTHPGQAAKAGHRRDRGVRA